MVRAVRCARAALLVSLLLLASCAGEPKKVVAPAAPLPLDLDRGLFRQALTNLLKNAHESGSAETDVELAIQALPGRVRIEVRDRGGGMSAAVLENALIPFYSTKRSGSGIGLALAREIAEAHGGRLGLQNREGGGLSVSLELPDAPNRSG